MKKYYMIQMEVCLGDYIYYLTEDEKVYNLLASRDFEIALNNQDNEELLKKLCREFNKEKGEEIIPEELMHFYEYWDNYENIPERFREEYEDDFYLLRFLCKHEFCSFSEVSNFVSKQHGEIVKEGFIQV